MNILRGSPIQNYDVALNFNPNRPELEKHAYPRIMNTEEEMKSQKVLNQYYAFV